MATLGSEWVPFTATDAARVAELWPVMPAESLPFADRDCIALAIREWPAMTADRRARLQLGIHMVLIR
jgi:hypothetical protein